MALLDLKHINITYHVGPKNVYAVQDANLAIEPQDAVGIVGESGSGKSTLAMGILQLLPDRVTTIEGEAIFEGVEWFHITGITPALSDALPAVTAEALAVCRRRGIPVYCDVNYRSALWTPERAGETMRALVRGIDTLIVNEEHAALLFGITSRKEREGDRLTDIAEHLTEEYGIRRVALTLRLSESAEINTVSGALYENGTLCRSRPYRVPIVDRVGGGDAFSAGLIHGFLCGWDPARTVEFASAANAFKHSVHGDSLVASEEEVARLASSDGTVRMIR